MGVTLHSEDDYLGLSHDFFANEIQMIKDICDQGSIAPDCVADKMDALRIMGILLWEKSTRKPLERKVLGSNI